MQELSSAQPSKVLLLEDSSADARLVQRLLEPCDDIALTWVTSVAAALAELDRVRVDAVLLDLLLPDAHGTDLIEVIKTAAPEAAIIVSSGQTAGDRLLARAIIRKGAEDFLPKAELTTALLGRTITTAIERARATAAIRIRNNQLEAALVDARIGHLSWTPTQPAVAIAGNLAKLLGVADAGPRISLRALLRCLSRPTRQSVYAAWREFVAGAERLAVVLVEDAPQRCRQARDLLVEAVAQRDAGGRILRLDALVRDTAAIDRVEQLETELLTHLAHELRTPLTTIRGALGLLAHDQEALATASARRLVEHAIANADRIDRIIGETVGRAANDRAERRVQPRRVPLGPHLYDAVTARLADTIEGTGVVPSSALTLAPASRAIEALVDSARLRRALDCLFARLATAATTPDPLTLDVTLGGGMAWLRIEPCDAAPPLLCELATGRDAATCDPARHAATIDQRATDQTATGGKVTGEPATDGMVRSETATCRPASAASANEAAGLRIAVPLTA